MPVDYGSYLDSLDSQNFAPPASRNPAGQELVSGPTGKMEMTKVEPNKLSADILPKEGFDPEYVLGLLKDATRASVANRKETIGDLMKQQSDILAGTKAQMDLTPVMSFVDNMYGTNLSKSYNAPESVNKNLQQVSRLRQAVNAEKQNIVEDEKNRVQLELKTRLAADKSRIEQSLKAIGLGLQAQKIEQMGKAGAKLKPLSDTAIKRISANDRAIETTQQIIAEIESNSEVLGFGKGFLSIKGMAKLPGKFGEYARTRQRVMSKLYKYVQRLGLVEEGGVLRKDDWDKMLMIFGDAGSDPQVILQIARGALRDIKKDKNNFLSLYEQANQYDVSGFKKERTQPKKKSSGKAKDQYAGVDSFKKLSKEERMKKLKARFKK